MDKLIKFVLATSLATSAFAVTYAEAPASSVTQAHAATTTKYAVVDRTTSLNIRASASTKGKVVGKYSLNDEVKVIKSYNNTWYQVLYKSKKRYVSKAYIKNVPSVIGIGYANTSKGLSLNIRASKSASSKIIGKYKNNEEIQITNGGLFNWYQVLYNGKVGYVSAKYVDGEHDFH